MNIHVRLKKKKIKGWSGPASFCFQVGSLLPSVINLNMEKMFSYQEKEGCNLQVKDGPAHDRPIGRLTCDVKMHTWNNCTFLKVPSGFWALLP